MSMIHVIPRATEKAYGQATSKNIYVFDVPLTANKQQISEAISEQFDVKVEGISTCVQSGKAVRFSRGKRSYPGTTHRKDTKKAYVKLAKGDSIQVFDQPTEQPAETKEEAK